MSVVTRTITKGIIAGLAAGIIATGVKTVWEMNFPVRDTSTESPPVILADRALKAVGGGGLSEQQKPQMGNVIHWTFGILVCVTYAMLAQKYRHATAGYGLVFGLGLYVVTHASVIPALGAEPWFFDNVPSFAFNEFAGHLAFGVGAEATRRLVSRKLASQPVPLSPSLREA